MSTVTSTLENPKDCKQFGDLKKAFCMSRKLFDKNNTCTHEPLQQTCYVHREMHILPQSKDECYEAFYARCHMNDYDNHIEKHMCVLAESVILEWCVCKKASNGTQTELTVEKDCTCFPHHTKPYNFFKLEDSKDGNSCVCTNIYRKKCDIPKNMTVLDAAINCTSVDDPHHTKVLIHCEESDYAKTVPNYKRNRLNGKQNTQWIEFRKNFIMNVRNKTKNSAENITQRSQTVTPNKKQESSSSPKGTQYSKIVSETPKITNKETFQSSTKSQLSLEETTSSLNPNNSTIDSMEEYLENGVSSSLNAVLGNESVTEVEKKLESLDSNGRLLNATSLLERTNLTEDILRSYLNKFHISQKQVTPKTPNNSYILNGQMISPYNNHYHYLRNYENEYISGADQSSTYTHILPFTLIPFSFIVALIVFFLYKKVLKTLPYSNLEPRMNDKNLKVDSNDSLDIGSFSVGDFARSSKEDLRNNSKRSFSIKPLKNSILYVRNSKEDKELLIENENIVE